jgi:membrane-associated PAP2 superfamily phosphatase
MESEAVRLRPSTLALLLIGFAISLVVAISLWAPDLDLELAQRLFDPVTRTFPVAAMPSLEFLRYEGAVSIVALLACVAAALVVKLMLPRKPLLVPGRAIIFLALTLAIGPGLLVNAVFKPHWGRPRPVEIVQFGGNETYVPWWNPDGGCPSNCSFVSGEVSIAAWLFAPAVLLPPPWRMAAMAAAGIFTFAVGVVRMAFGGHFFTDVAFGALMTLLVIWLTHGLIFRWRHTRLDERVVDRRLSRFAFQLRRMLNR